jgi:NitT/TauT family transport system substrate-binding protein
MEETMRNWKVSGLYAAAAFGLTVAAISSAGSQELKTLNILVANERATSEYPIYVAEELGFYADEGLDVNFLPSSTTVPYLAFLSNGDAELVMLDPAQVLQAVDNAQPASIIYEYMQLGPERLVVPASSDVQTIADLKGKTIGMASDRDQVTVTIALDTVGLAPEDVESVVIGDSVPLIITQMRDGAIDAFAGGTNETGGFEANGIELRYLTPPEILQAPGNSMVIWNERREELRDSIVGFLRAWNKASTAAMLDLEAIAGMARKFVPEQWETPDQGQAILEEAAYELLLQRTRLRGEPQPDVWANLQEPYLKLGQIKEVYDPATFLDGSFIEPAYNYTTEEVKEALAEWRAANQQFLTP